MRCEHLKDREDKRTGQALLPSSQLNQQLDITPVTPQTPHSRTTWPLCHPQRANPRAVPDLWPFQWFSAHNARFTRLIRDLAAPRASLQVIFSFT